MALRFVEAPQQNTNAFVPRTEFLVSGVQQAQQRHDTARQAWSNNVIQAMDRGYLDDNARETYMKQQQQLYDNVIDTNLGNLSAGAGDVLSAIETDRANPYHNLNKKQLEQAAQEQKLATTYGDKAIVLSDVAGTPLMDEAGNWINSNDPSLEANVIQSLDYDVEAEKQSADLRASIVDATSKLKAQWDAQGLPVNSASQLRQLSEQMIDDYLNRGGLSTYLNNVGGVMQIDNSVNANYDPSLQKNQFQDDEGNVDKEKVRDYFKGQILDKVFVEGIRPPQKAPNPITRVNVSVNNAGATIPVDDNIALSSIYKQDVITPEMFGSIKEEVQKSNTNIKDLNTNNTRILTALNQQGLNVKSVSDIIKYTTNGVIDPNKLPANVNADNIITLTANVGDNLVAIEQAEIDKQRYSNIYNTAFNKAANDISEEEYQDQFKSFGNVGLDKKALEILKVNNVGEFKSFFKENYNLTQDEFVNKYKNKLQWEGDELEVIYEDYIQAGALSDKIEDNLKNNEYVNTVKFNTNTNTKSPEAIHEKAYSQAFEGDINRIFTNFTDQFGNQVSNIKLDASNESEKGLFEGKGAETVGELFEDEGAENLELEFNNPGINDMLSGANTHITIKDKKSGKIYARIPNARNVGDPDFAREIAARKFKNALSIPADKRYQEAYLTRSLAEYGAATNSENIWKSGAKFTPPGETSDITLSTTGGDVTYKIEGYNVGNNNRLKIYDNNGEVVVTNVKKESLYSFMYILAGRHAALNDTNASNILSEGGTSLSKQIKEISGSKLKQFERAIYK